MKIHLNKPRLLSYGVLGVVLSVTALSALYTLFLLLSDLSCDTPVALLFACMTLLAWLAAFFLGFKLVPATVYGFSAILWFCCTLAFWLFSWFQATDLFSDAFFSLVLSVLSFPLWALMPLATFLSFGSETARLILSVLLSSLLTVAPILLFVLSRRHTGDASV